MQLLALLVADPRLSLLQVLVQVLEQLVLVPELEQQVLEQLRLGLGLPVVWLLVQPAVWLWVELLVQQLLVLAARLPLSAKIQKHRPHRPLTKLNKYNEFLLKGLPLDMVDPFLYYLSSI